MSARRKTHCIHGHPRIPENLDRLRACKVCRRERARLEWTAKGYRGRRLERYRTDPEYRARETARVRRNNRRRAAAAAAEAASIGRPA